MRFSSHVSKFAPENLTDVGTANRVCQLFQYRSGFAFSGHGRIPERPRTAERALGADAIDFSLVRCTTGEMQLRPRMHLLAWFANIFSSSTSSPLFPFRILRQMEELKFSFENVGNEKYCLYMTTVSDIRHFEEKKILKVKRTFITYYFTFAHRLDEFCELEGYPKK